MRRDRSTFSFASNPALIGAMTVLIAVTGVMLTYNATQGLPFVPTYNVSVDVSDAGGVTANRDVRIAGKRVGVIQRIEARRPERGRPVARMFLKIDLRASPIRSDTVATVRPLSPLGAKYVELVPGARGRALREGETLPAGQARPTVELTDAFNLFDERTRRAVQTITTEFGTGVAGRGVAFNELIEQAPPLLRRLERVSRDVSDPRVRLSRLIRGGAATAGELAAARGALGSGVAAADTTLGALDAARLELADALLQLPATETAGTSALRTARPALSDAEAFLRDARPGLRVLRPAARELHLALVPGIRVLRRAPRLADDLDAVLRSVRRLARDPATRPVLVKLRLALRSLRPTLDYLAPLQLRCNYLGLSGRNVPSSISEGDASGTGLRTLALMGRPSEQFPSAGPVPGLNVNPYAHVGETGECESGNEPFSPGGRIGNPPGDQGATEPTTIPPGVGAP